MTRTPGSWRVVVGVAGSIAAYKAPFVVRVLREAGHEVRVVPTEAALRFIGAPALAAVSGHPVSTGVFDDPAAVEHVATAEWADLVLVAPASADLVSRVAAGRADDLLTATILTTRAPVVLAPAMHTQMWTNPATVENVATLRRRGLTVIEPDSGRLTGADSGVGRFPEPDRVVADALAALRSRLAGTRSEAADDGAAPSHPDLPDLPEAAGALDGLRVVVSAGGTREPLDPVRFLGNRSSGRQGCAVAGAAARAGAHVTLVQAHVEAALLGALPPSVTVVAAGTALEMASEVRRAAAHADAVVMAAAVADYRPATVAASKIKKHGLDAPPTPAESSRAGSQACRDAAAGPVGTPDGQAGDGVGTATAPTITLVENPDILAGLVADPPRAGLVVVGFAAETGDGEGDALAHGVAKARRKGADLLAVNPVGEDLGFGDVPNAVIVLDRDGTEVARAAGTKDEVATALVGLLAERLAAR